MGTYQHKLKRVKAERAPRNWCFFDVEAKIDRSNPGSETHTCKLGWLCYYHREANGNPAKEVWRSFRSADGFWNHLLRHCEIDRKLIIIGYNVGYDFRLVDGFRCLAARGYTQKRLYYKSHVVIMSFKKGKHNIVILDAMNYFTGKLESWGEMLGVPKGEVDFDTVSDVKLSAYCKQDVLILRNLMLKLWSFLAVNNLGGYAVTKASQAMQAYRRTYMTRGIYIHADPNATKLERDAYYGGRSECFFIGSPPFRQFWKLDINSQYPFIMRDLPVPYNFRRVVFNPTLESVSRLLESKGVIAQVVLNTNIPAFPVRYNKRICFPLGRFTTTLAAPELKLALKSNVVAHVNALAIYDIAIRFRGYVNDMYALRIRYKQQSNIVFEQLAKYMMNSLYGKFGQYNEHTEECPNDMGLPDGEHLYVNLETGSQCRIVVIAGQCWRTTGKTESCNSFPGIAAYITSAARVYLWESICKAGRKNVYYTDTDSLIVNRTGWRRMRDKVDSERLGAFKLEYVTNKLIIHCPKDYETDQETCLKGITSSARRTGKGTYTQEQWQGLRGAIATGQTNKVVLTTVVKTLLRKYHKGIVGKDGYVTPYVLNL